MFLGVWSLTLGAALLATVMVLPGTYRSGTAPAPNTAMVGLWTAADGEWPTLGPPVGSEAVRSGLRRGDRLLTVDGKPAAATPAGLEAQLAGQIGSTLAISTRSLNGVRSNHTLTRNPAHYRQALAAVGLTPLAYNVLRTVPYFIDIVLFLTCAVILMARRWRDPLAPWASLMMVSMVLGFGAAGERFAGLFAHPAMANYVANAVPFSLLLVVLAVFPTGRFEPRWSLPVAVVGILGTIATEPLSPVQSNSFMLIVQFAAVAAIAVRYRGMLPGAGRQQIRWALLGFGAAVIALCVFVTMQFMASRVASFGAHAWLFIGMAVLGSLMFFLLILGITIGLLRYRLYDADTAISRSIVYGALTLSLLAIFAGSEKVIEILGERYFGEELGALAGGLGAAIAAVMIAPIHHRVSHWAERRFRSGLAHLRHGLPLLVGDLRETASPRALADAMLARVERGVRARHGAVLVGGALLATRDVEPAVVDAWLAETTLPDEASDALYRDRADPLFPMRVPLQADGAGLVGWLLLGPRPDGSFYGREDRAALREIADPVARALAIATARERREEGRDREIAGLRNIVRRLQARIEEGSMVRSAAT